MNRREFFRTSAMLPLIGLIAPKQRTVADEVGDGIVEGMSGEVMDAIAAAVINEVAAVIEGTDDDKTDS